MAKDKETARTVLSTLTSKSLEEMIETYHIPRDKHPLVPAPGQNILNPPAGCVGVYHQHLKAGLRFPAHGFIGALLAHYGVHLIQVAPNGFRKIQCFIFICKVLDVSP